MPCAACSVRCAGKTTTATCYFLLAHRPHVDASAGKEVTESLCSYFKFICSFIDHIWRDGQLDSSGQLDKGPSVLHLRIPSSFSFFVQHFPGNVQLFPTMHLVDQVLSKAWLVMNSLRESSFSGDANIRVHVLSNLSGCWLSSRAISTISRSSGEGWRSSIVSDSSTRARVMAGLQQRLSRLSRQLRPRSSIPGW